MGTQQTACPCKTYITSEQHSQRDTWGHWEFSTAQTKQPSKRRSLHPLSCDREVMSFEREWRRCPPRGYINKVRPFTGSEKGKGCRLVKWLDFLYNRQNCRTCMGRIMRRLAPGHRHRSKTLFVVVLPTWISWGFLKLLCIHWCCVMFLCGRFTVLLVGTCLIE